MQSEVRGVLLEKRTYTWGGGTFKAYESVQGEGGSQILMIFERTYFLNGPLGTKANEYQKLNFHLFINRFFKNFLFSFIYIFPIILD